MTSWSHPVSVDAAQRSCEPLERVQDLWGAVSGAEEAQAKMHGMLAPLAAAAGRATSAGGGEDESLRALRDGVDEVMRSTEEALLVTRLLLRHAAELLAFVHHVDVPVHPSQHHKVGGKTRKLPQAPVLAAVASPAALARQAVDDVRGFAVEKYGIPPDVSVVAPAAANAARVTCVPPLLLYTLAEVLKNAVTALEAQHGAWDLDEALPIVVTVRLPEASGSVSGVDRDNKAVPAPAAADFFWPTGADPTVGGAATGVGVGDGAAPSPGGSGSAGRDASGRVCTAPSMWEIEVVDYAGGMPDASLASVGRFFFSTVRASPAPGYGYSKDHGAQFAGLGVGVPMAQMYAEVMGGTLTVARHEDGHGHGTRATLQLPADGFSLRC